MINTLLVSNKIKNMSDIINNLTMKHKSIRIYSVATSLENVSKISERDIKNINLIIFDISLKDAFNFQKKIEFILKYNYFINNNIIISKSNDNIFNNHYIENIFLFNNLKELLNNLPKIIDSINDTSYNNKLHIIENRIYKYLFQLGYKISHFGTKYLVSSILLIYKNNKQRKINLEKDIYPIIAQKYNTTTHNVKCCITKATKYMNKHLKLSNKQKYSIFFVDDYINTMSVINNVLSKM